MILLATSRARLAPAPAPEAPQDALARLLPDWLARVTWLARQCWGPGPHGLCLEDLVQEGVIGLLDALTKYDPAHGASFATYADLRMAGAMRDALREADPAPRSLRTKARTVAQAQHAVEHQHGRAAEPVEVAAALGMTPAQYDRWQCALRPLRLLSLDYAYDASIWSHSAALRPGERWTLRRRLAAPEAACLDADLRDRVRAAIDDLPSRMRIVLRLRYDEGLELKTIGVCLGVSESRASQLHTHACQLLAQRLAPYVDAARPPAPRAVPVLLDQSVLRTLAASARHTGLLYQTLSSRLRRGWDLEQALSTPVAKKKEG